MMSLCSILHSFVFISFHLSISIVCASSSSSISDNYTSNNHLCPSEQSLSLLHFKQNLFSFNYSTPSPFYYGIDYYCERWLGSGYHPKMMTWNRSTDCCKWDGVTCNRFTGDVIGLDLGCSKLNGVIDSNNTSFHLPQLRRLNLAYNNFIGSHIPQEIGRFANSLTHLNLSYSGFEGVIPSEISFLPKLVSLDLSFDNELRLEPRILNKLLQNSSQLRELSLEEVNMSSSGLPAYLNLTSLRYLNLRWTGLSGKLPDNIFSLPYLQKLELSNNIDINGSLLKVVNNSIRIPLEWLDLSDTSLSGEIPYSIGNLESLKFLDLSKTILSGEIPDSIGNLKSLDSLYLRNTRLLGGIPYSIGHLESLNYLDLSYTFLSGEIPDSIGNLTSMVSLVLSNCYFVGALPKSLTKLTHLNRLSLSNNMINGSLPSGLFTDLPSLIEISLSNNTLSGNIPSEVPFSFRSLMFLHLDHNQLVGPIPQSSFLQLLNLTRLSLSFNNLTGVWELERLFSTLTKLYYLDLSYSGLSVVASNVVHFINPNFAYIGLASCKLTVVPEFLRSMKNLDTLDLSNNEIQGPLPLSFCNMIYLYTLDISDNSFSGVIPQCFGSLFGNSLTMVDMRNNLFSGTIPRINGGCTLSWLTFNTNLLQGDVPRSLAKCKNLEVLDLGNNRFNGTFPNWLEHLPILQVLVLSLNNLHGSITSSSTLNFPFPKLRILDLSQNSFEGYLPNKYFSNFMAMRNVETSDIVRKYIEGKRSEGYSITVAIKNMPIELVKILNAYTIIDLSCNELHGAIPDVIGSLHSLKVLNLSHNSLIGPIPHALGHLSQIESLDLSWNQLGGEIPQELANLTFLTTLNLSQNYLVGRIPSGTQFSTFETAFLGNPGLCGFPLPKSCPGNNREHPVSPGLEDDPDIMSGFTWKVVILGYGCGALAGLVMGYLMFLTGRPKWFNAAVEREEQRIRKRQKKRNYAYRGR